MDIIKIRGIILFIIAFLNLLLALFIFSKSKNDKTKFWLGILALSSGLFAFTCGGSYFFWQEYSITSAYWWRATWLGIFIIPSLNIFTYYFTKNTKNIIIKGIILYSVALVISFLALTTDLFVKTLYPNRSGMFLTGPTGSLDFLGRIFILVGFLIALTSLLRKYIKSSHDEKLKFNYFIWSTVLCVIGGIVLVSIIPLFTGDAFYYDIPALLSFIWVAVITYSVFKYNLFDMRVFASELLIFGTWILLFIRIVLSENNGDLLMNIILSILLTILGILFLKSINKETELNKKLLEETKKNLDLEKKLSRELIGLSGKTIRKMENELKK